MVDRPLAALEGADPLPRPPLPRRHLRRPRQRASDRPEGAAAYADARVRRRRARRAGRRRAPSARRSSASPPARSWGSAARRRPPRPGAGRRLHRARRRRSRRARRAAVRPRFEEELDSTDGLGEVQPPLLAAHYREFLEFFFAQALHRAALDQADRGLRRLGAGDDAGDAGRHVRAARSCAPPEPFAATLARIRCPTLVIHGDDDRIRPHAQGAALAAATGGALVTLEGAGHLPHARDPVQVNLLLRDFVGAARRPPRGGGAASCRGRRRALFVSSPDRAGPRAARPRDRRRAARAAPRPGDRLARAAPGHRDARGARASASTRPAPTSPASPRTSSRSPPSTTCTASRPSGAWTRSSSPNFMVFNDLVRDDPYDLWIGDEAWELDYFLHENPELKTAAYAWLTDFVGWLPVEGAGGREHDAHRRLQRGDDRADRPLPAGARPRDLRRRRGRRRARGLRPRPAGDPRLDRARTSTSRATSPASTPPRSPTARQLRARARLPPRASRSASSPSAARASAAALLRRVMASFPEAKALVPGLRMIVVAGPRIDPATLPAADGLEVRAYVRRPLPAPRGLRPRRRPGRPDDRDGAHRQRPAVPLLPAQAPLRADHPRPPPARAPRRRPAHGLRGRPAAGDRRTRSRRRSAARSPTARCPPTARRARRRCWPSCSEPGSTIRPHGWRQRFHPSTLAVPGHGRRRASNRQRGGTAIRSPC